MDPIQPKFLYGTVTFDVGGQQVSVSISPSLQATIQPLTPADSGPVNMASASPDGMVSPGSDPLPAPTPAAPHLGDGHLLLAASQLTAQVLALVLQFKSLFAVPLLVQPPAAK